ncbi:hypothetical protein Leryth_019342 [Lithospermum erythrorhizon]|nr:hypothetical protein Leryth_019342 [Lithospermum erythrorhizon]
MNSLIVVAFVWLATITFIYKKFHKTRRLPPGPWPWPIFGNLFQLGNLPHVSLDKLSKKYGEIMTIRFGVKDVVVASSPEMAQEFLKTQDSSFASRPALAAGKYLSYNYMDLSFAPYGPNWKLSRKICLNELFTAKRLDSFKHIRVDERLHFLSRIFSQNGKSIVLKEHLRRFTLSSISRIILGDKYFSDFKESPLYMSLDEIAGLLDEWVVLNGVFNIGDWVPFLQRFDLQGYIKRMKILHEKMDKFFNYVIDDHKASMEGENNWVPKDMVDVLLMQCFHIDGDEQKIPIEGAKGLLQDLLAGGTDSSASTIEWAIHELVRHPNILKGLRAELDTVIGHERWVEEDDYCNLPYLEAIIKETFRLHPLVPFLTPHLAIHDCNVSGYHIPKGTIILINTWSIGKDPNSWKDPYEFNPERFLQGDDIDMTGKDFRLLPFGSGRRKCPAYNLGLKFVRTTLANIIHGFELQLPEGSKVEDICMIERFGLTICPEVPISLILTPTLPHHMYLQ